MTSHPIRPFARPWRLIQRPDEFEIRDDNGLLLCAIPFEGDPGRSTPTRRLGKNDARRLAAQVLRLPELIRIAKGINPDET